MRKSSKITGIATLVLIVVCIALWNAAVEADHHGTLSIDILGVQKGTAALVVAPSGRTLLLDDGVDNTLARTLSSTLPWWQRGIDVALVPDGADLSDVLARYSVGHVIEAPQRGQVIDLGGGVFVQILFPDRDVSNSPEAANCIVAKIKYGDTSIMVSCGDSAIEEYLVRLDANDLRSDALYSSDASSSPLFAGFVGANVLAQKGETIVSDGESVTLK